MYLGALVEVGDAESVYSRPCHPYSEALISAIPVPDPQVERNRKRVVLEGDPPSPLDPPSGCRYHPRCAYAMDICKTVDPGADADRRRRDRRVPPPHVGTRARRPSTRGVQRSTEGSPDSRLTRAQRDRSRAAELWFRRMTTVAHPLELVTEEEVAVAAALDPRSTARFPEGAVFAHLRLHEPDKDAVLGFTSGDAVDREVEALVIPSARSTPSRWSCRSPPARSASWTVHEGMRPALLFGESMQAIAGIRAAPGVAGRDSRARHRGLRPRADRSVAGRYRSTRRTRRAGASAAASRTCASRSTDNGYARPIEGVLVFVDHDDNAGARGDRPRRGANAAGARLVPPRRGRSAPHRPQAARHRAARRPELHRRRQPRAVAALVVPRRLRPVRGPGPASGQYHDGDRLRPVLYRVSITEMVVPYGDPRADARLEERVRRRRVGPRPHGQLAEARVRLPRRDHVPRRRALDRAGRRVHRRSTRSACTKRTTGSSGSTTTCRAAPTKCGARAASSSASSPPSATTSTASTGTCTSTGTSSSR